MGGILYRYLSGDHDRLDELLQRTVATPGVVDMQSYGGFRKGLLRHIAMEEKIVVPEIARLQGGRQPAVAERIHLDHGALVALLVPPPSASIVATIRSILQVHNALEEREGGLYQLLEQLVGPGADTVLKTLTSLPEVPVLPHNERPEVIEATRRAVARAGYEFKTMPE